MWGVAEAEAGRKPEVVTAKLSGHRDPGYWETARMLLESALCLALQVQPAVHLAASMAAAASTLHPCHLLQCCMDVMVD